MSRPLALIPVLAALCLLCWGRQVRASEPPQAETPATVVETLGLPVSVPGVPETVSYRVGYLEAGSLEQYINTMTATVRHLAERGVLGKLSFPLDAHFSPGWENSRGKDAYLSAARKLMARRDLDLIISMGTDASSAILEANNGRTPVVGMSMTDPVLAGIVPLDPTLRAPNFVTRVINDRWASLFRFFHSTVDFHQLGLMHSTAEFSSVFTNLSDAVEVARERGYEVLVYGALPPEQTLDQCKAGLDLLIKQGMDAFYVGALFCFDPVVGKPGELYEYLNERGVATFGVQGPKDVREGALMGASTFNFDAQGAFYAEVIEGILEEGRSPASFEMFVDPDLKIALNLSTADTLGLDFPLPILIASDAIFHATESDTGSWNGRRAQGRDTGGHFEHKVPEARSQ